MQMSQYDIWFVAGHLVCVAQWIVFIFLHWAYHKNFRVRYPLLWSALIVCGALAIALFMNVEFFSAASVMLSFGVLILSSLMFEGTAGGRFISSLIGGVMCLLTQNTVRYLASWITKKTLNEVLCSASFLIMMILVTIVVGIIAACTVCSWQQRKALEPLHGLLMSFFPGVVVLLNMILMMSVDPDSVVTPLYLFLMPGLTLAVLGHLGIVFMFNDQVLQRRNTLFRAELEQQRAEALLDSYTAQRHMTHEFTNHANAVDALLEQGDVTAARQYLASVTKIIAAGTSILNTHNPLLDSLLSKKYETAAQQEVKIFFNLCDMSELPLSGVELVVVVSNTMDNAIRAAAQADPPEIYVRARKTKDDYIISVRNRVKENVPLQEGQLPQTTKKEPGHGMGLSNVRDALKKYSGEFTLSCSDKWFRFTCAVPIDKI